MAAFIPIKRIDSNRWLVHDVNVKPNIFHSTAIFMGCKGRPHPAIIEIEYEDELEERINLGTLEDGRFIPHPR